MPNAARWRITAIRTRRAATRAVFVSAVAWLVGGCGLAPAPREASEVGVARCAPCHRAETDAWRGSHHALAMQVAADSTVRGDFSGVEAHGGGETARFFRRDGRFMVRIDGTDGRPADFAVDYTFGVAPLQQYLVAFPGGRYQTLPFAWDTRPAGAGGQRWFHLYPGERLTPDDELHWTRWTQNWNLQCAVCHSTDLRKGYDPATRSYRTTWSELDVSCEACHGPGSRHVEWAGRRLRFEPFGGDHGLVVTLDERRGVEWIHDPATGRVRRDRPRASAVEIETCARCHARRTRMAESDPPAGRLTDAHLPAIIAPGIYHADGQLLGENYEYGSFVQSRMAAAGVTCSDCHEPHSGGLRAPGDQVCFRCHAETGYATPKHHLHPAGSKGASCIACHMPSHTYMVVHERHDHSLRVPRPAVSAALGVPDACTSCHHDRTPAWAESLLVRATGHSPRAFQRHGEALAAAWRGAEGADPLLLAVLGDSTQSPFARASAAAAFAERTADEPAIAALGHALGDPDPLVRIGALQGLVTVEPARRWTLASARLADPSPVVRALAASVLTPAAERATDAERAAFARADAEYVAAQRENADQPWALVNLGNRHRDHHEDAAAESSYIAALALDPRWVPAAVNLADLLREQGRDAEGEQVLREALRRHPDAASLHHALGLLAVRAGRRDEALAELARAAALAPESARYAYVVAVALADAGRLAEARRVVDAALARHPGDADLRVLRDGWAAAKR